MVILFLVVVMLLPSVVSLAASAPMGISEVKIATGEMAIEELEREGYIVIYQNLNYAPGAEERIYLGYKQGSDPICGLVTASELESNLTYEDVVYTPVSDVDLNAQTGGTPVYLYYTKDENAGSGIAALTTFARSPKNDIDIPDCFGDGSCVVRTTEGMAADFEAGIEDYALYFFMIRSSLCLPYLSEIKTVEISDNENAFEKLAATGCDYYMQEPVGTSGATATYICYNRTDNASDAVRLVAVSDAAMLDGAEFTLAGSGVFGESAGNLYYTKSQDLGNPVTELTSGALMSSSFTLGEWALSYFGGRSTAAASVLFRDEAYDVLTSSEEAFTQRCVGVYENGEKISETNIYAVMAENGLISEINAEEPSLPEDEIEEPYALDGEVHDEEDTAIEKSEEEDTDETEEAYTQAESGTAIGSGSLIAIAVLLLIAMILTFIFAMVSSRKNRDDEEGARK